MKRRDLLGAVPLLAMTPALGAIPPGERLAFTVRRDGTPIGTHTLAFARNGEDVEVRIAIDLAVRLMGITLYRYTHRNVETWRGERVVSVDSTTDRNGRPYSVRARAGADGIVVEGSETGRYTAPIDAATTSYWHARFLRAVKIDTQGGKLVRASIASKGEEAIPIGTARMPAQRYEVRGDLSLDIWYDRAGTWSGLLFRGEDGSTIAYERA